jgi:hypothetical protein
MADQFDLEQGIMGCWNVTSDLDVLFEELVENSDFTTDQASNFVLGLSTIYEAKFAKLFRTFEEFLAQWYAMKNELKQTQQELDNLRYEQEEIDEANSLAVLAGEFTDRTLEELFNEQEEELRLADENDRIDFVEDEFGYFHFQK